MKKPLLTIACAALAVSAAARTYELKLLGSRATSETRDEFFNDKSKAQAFRLKVGSSAGRDSLDPIEIRAATVIKDVTTKKSMVNDIARHTFNPTNRAAFFRISTGLVSRTTDTWAGMGGNATTGYLPNGVIVELWQNDKCLKHLASTTGPIAKTSLTDDTPLALLSEKGSAVQNPANFTNKTTIAEDANGSKSAAAF